MQLPNLSQLPIDGNYGPKGFDEVRILDTPTTASAYKSQVEERTLKFVAVSDTEIVDAAVQKLKSMLQEKFDNFFRRWSDEMEQPVPAAPSDRRQLDLANAGQYRTTSTSGLVNDGFVSRYTPEQYAEIQKERKKQDPRYTLRPQSSYDKLQVMSPESDDDDDDGDDDDDEGDGDDDDDEGDDDEGEASARVVHMTPGQKSAVGWILWVYSMLVTVLQMKPEKAAGLVMMVIGGNMVLK